jgi:hypothetical protein
MELKITKTKSIRTEELFSQIGPFLSKRSHWALALVSFGLLLYCGWQWYLYVYKPGWDEAKKQEYLATKEKDVVFSKGKFERAVLLIEARKQEYQKKLEDVPDIFRIK